MSSYVDFCLICEFKTHNQNMINLMKQYHENFHQLKDEFSELWLRNRGKKTIAKLFAKSLCQLETKVLNDILDQKSSNSVDKDLVDNMAEDFQFSPDDQNSITCLHLLRRVVV